MRARFIVPAGLMVLAAACSDRSADPVTDAPDASPDLALTAPDGVPIASDVEVHRPENPERPQPDAPTPERSDRPRPEPEPAAAGDIAADVTDYGSGAHVHPKADPEGAVSAPVATTEPARGGGKPRTGVTEGRGPVPDRTWGDDGVGIMDDPDPIPAVIAGRPGAVIIRGGAGRIDDDCAIHGRGIAGGVMAGIIGGIMGGAERPGGMLVNDRDPRRGALINDRAPRTPNGGSLPRGAGFPRGGGIRFR